MAHAKITLIGFYNYMKSINDDLFKNLSTPAGIDKDLLINNILMLGGEYEVLWGDPFFYQNMIGVWSAKWQHTMKRWIDALSIEYNPLENYDRMEDWQDDSSKVSSNEQKETSANNSKNANIQNISDKKSEDFEKKENAIALDSSSSKGDGTTTNERSAYDSSNYEPHDKSISDTSGSNDSSGITSAEGNTKTTSDDSTSIISQNTADGNETKNINNNAIDSGTSVHSGRMHGNIGVTTSQQMLQAELDISKWNLYNEIAELFISEMLIYVDD